MFDGKVLEAINDLEVGLALRVIDTFEAKDLEDARNLNALFMATIKITKEQVRPWCWAWGTGTARGRGGKPVGEGGSGRRHGMVGAVL